MKTKEEIENRLKEIDSQIEFNKKWLKTKEDVLKPSEYSDEENNILNLIVKKNLLKWVLSSINTVA